jgi:glutamate dehydrogenase
MLGEAPGITEIAARTGSSVPDAARVHLEIGDQLRIADLVAKSASIGTSDQYDCVAIARALHRLESAQADFSRAAIAAGGVEAWRAGMGERLARMQLVLDEVAGEGALTLSRLLVAADQLSELAAAPSASASRVRRRGRTRSAANGTRPVRKNARRPRS